MAQRTRIFINTASAKLFTVESHYPGPGIKSGLGVTEGSQRGKKESPLEKRPRTRMKGGGGVGEVMKKHSRSKLFYQAQDPVLESLDRAQGLLFFFIPKLMATMTYLKILYLGLTHGKCVRNKFITIFISAMMDCRHHQHQHRAAIGGTR